MPNHPTTLAVYIERSGFVLARRRNQHDWTVLCPVEVFIAHREAIIAEFEGA